MELEHDNTQALSENNVENNVSASTASQVTPLAERSTRSSARVRAAKEKEIQSQIATSSIVSQSTAGPSNDTITRRITRAKDKGKQKETPTEILPKHKRNLRSSNSSATAVTAASLVINEPPRDLKGKKRAAPEPDSEEEVTRPSKKPRTTTNLRSKTTKGKKPVNATTTRAMAKKSKSQSKSKSALEEKKRASVAGPSNLPEDDVEMIDGELHSDEDEPIEDDHPDCEGGGEGEGEHEDDDEDDDAPPPPSSGAAGGLDESAAMSIFGGDIQAFGSYMLSLSSRLKTILTNIKPKADPSTRLVALQELSEILSMATEDTLAGYFQTDSFVKELVAIMGGTGGDAAKEEGDREGDEDHQDEDAALAAALALSSGGVLPGDDNLEAQVLACRCLANLMEALPGCAHTVVYHGAVPVLCSKLVEITYIDLAEQTLSTIEKISEEYPSAIVREGGLGALLNYLDFFSTHIQRVALQAASNCCRNASPDSFNMIRDVFPTIRSVLAYSDQKSVEYAALCVIRIIESYQRSSPDLLDTLLDVQFVKAINALLIPSGGSALGSSSSYTLLLRALSTACRASPKITLSLLEADVVSTLYQILTGVLPPSGDGGGEQGDAADGQGLGGGLADMVVMQNLAHKPKDQIEEALSLVSELMPPLPKDGVFDHRGYTDKALARLTKAKAKAERASSRQTLAPTASLVSQDEAAPAAPEVPNPGAPEEFENPLAAIQLGLGGFAGMGDTPKETSVNRVELLRSKPEVVGKFLSLTVPILVDVYAASATLHVRIKTMTGILKAISFLDGAELEKALRNVPIASFVGSILSSKDQPTLVLCALQLVELLLMKLPSEYKPSFRREGVLHELEALADEDLAPKVKTEPLDATPPLASALQPLQALPGLKRLTSLSLDPQDAIVLRARVVRFKYVSGVDTPVDGELERLGVLVQKISDPSASEEELKKVLGEVADLFVNPSSSVSSFEFMRSGLVDGLLDFATSDDRIVPVSSRRRILFESFCVSSADKRDSPSPMSLLVKRLQESLTRIESYDVVTVSQGADDSKRNSASMLARQLRLRLVAEGSDIPRSCSNITVSIHAIATFQALNDYLRPRVAANGTSTSATRFSGALAAAFASAAGITIPASARSNGASGSTSSPPAQSIGGPSSASSAPTAPPASDSTGKKVETPRRSLRLSAKESPGNAESSSTAPAAEEPEAEEANSSGSREDLMEEEIDADVLEEELETQPAAADRTISVAVAEDGAKVVAQTPEGTRVATPNPNMDQPTIASPASPTKTSYASAIRSKPMDWHIVFSMDDHVLPLDMTIYGAVHQQEARKGSSVTSSANLWSGIYTIKFKKVPGPAPSAEEVLPDRSASPSSTAVPENAPHSKILRLLRVLHKLNAQAAEHFTFAGPFANVSESAFVNNKLTAKLTRQLEEPMIVASACLPDWALDLPQHFPFLFPFSTRFSFLQSTSFGYARLILKWQSQQSRTGDSSRRDDAFGYLGRLQRQKVRISRKFLLESAIKVMELYGSSSSVLEVEYFEEVGTGLGPTLEFYSLVSREFARRNIKMWHDVDTSAAGPYVSHPTGLFPAPFSFPEITKDRAKGGGKKRSDIFRVLGQFVAKALLDSRIIDVSFSKIFLKLILGMEVPLTVTGLQLVDPGLANSLSKLQTYANARKAIEATTFTTPEEKEDALEAVTIDGASLADLALDFTLPGYSFELKPLGRELTVDPSNIEEYIREVIDAFLGSGVRIQAQAFREGFSKVFPITDLQSFSSDELAMMFGNAEEDWSAETLSEALKADHGFNTDSRAIRDLIDIMSSYDTKMRRDLLQFITGSPRLPVGGFRGLNPPLTVVRKPHEAPLTPDDYLPSVMTCVNYLKLPEYSSKSVMMAKLLTAVREGVGSFHLS